LASSAVLVCADSYRINSISTAFQAQHILPVEELHAALGAALGQLLREGAGVAAFVGAGVGAADDVLAVGAKRRFDLQQLVAADHAALHAMLAHQFHGMGRIVKRFLVGIEMCNTALEPVVLDARAAHHVLERAVAVRAQGHQLLHIAFEGAVVALRQKTQAPAPLLPVQLRAKQQRGLLVEHPLERLPGSFAVRPRLAVAHRNLPCVGKTCLQRSPGLAVDHNDLVAALAQMPRRAD